MSLLVCTVGSAVDKDVGILCSQFNMCNRPLQSVFTNLIGTGLALDH